MASSGFSRPLPKFSPTALGGLLLGGFILARLKRREDCWLSEVPCEPAVPLVPMVKEMSWDWREGAIQL